MSPGEEFKKGPSRDSGTPADGELLLHEIISRQMSYAEVVVKYNKLVLEPRFQEKHPQLFIDGKLPTLDTTKLRKLIRGESTDRGNVKLIVLAELFEYDSYKALSLDKTFHHKLSPKEHNAKLLIANWIHSHRPAPHEQRSSQCLLKFFKLHMVRETLAQIHPDLEKLDLTTRELRNVFRALEKAGLIVSRQGRYLLANTPISAQIENVRNRCWVLERCIAKAYSLDFGSPAYRKAIARLIKDPLEDLSKVRDPEKLDDVDADCQVALTGGHSSLYQHILVELPNYHSAVSYLVHKRRDNPKGPYPQNYQFASFEDWFKNFNSINFRKWESIYEKLLSGTSPQRDLVKLLEQMTDLTCNNLKAVEYSIASPLGKAKENHRYANLPAMESP